MWGKGNRKGGGGVKGQRVGVRVERVFYKSINLKRLSNADSKFFTLPKFFLPHSHTHTHTLAQLPPTLRGGCGINLPTANSELRTAANCEAGNSSNVVANAAHVNHLFAIFLATKAENDTPDTHA